MGYFSDLIFLLLKNDKKLSQIQLGLKLRVQPNLNLQPTLFPGDGQASQSVTKLVIINEKNNKIKLKNQIKILNSNK